MRMVWYVCRYNRVVRARAQEQKDRMAAVRAYGTCVGTCVGARACVSRCGAKSERAEQHDATQDDPVPWAGRCT